MPRPLSAHARTALHLPGQRLPTAGFVLCLLGIFCLAGAWQVPDENETHYLVKARHFADRTWVAGDLFTDSADAHCTFYIVCGWWTRWLSLTNCARLGRLLTWTAIAWSWYRLGQSLRLRPSAILLAAALYVSIDPHTRFSGEWLIGGFEAKGPAYACVLAACAALIQSRWTSVWTWLGAAVAWHPLVGGWASLVIVGIACSEAATPLAKPRWPWKALLLAGALACVGVLPPLTADLGVPGAVITEAWRIYVFERLPHHLVPQAFARAAVLRFSAATLAWSLLAIALWRGTAAEARHAAGERRWNRFLSGSLLLALVGTLLGFALESQPEWAARLLRLYWFRLADVMIPLGLSFAIVRALTHWRSTRPGLAICAAAIAAAFSAGQLGQTVYTAQRGGPRSEEMIAPQRRADWISACEWIRQHTRPEARVLTPPFVQTFKWRAERPEVVNWKDIPQDARSIVAWWERMTTLFLWVDDGQAASASPRTPHATARAAIVFRQPSIRATLRQARQRRWIRSLTQLPVQRMHTLAPRYGYEFVLTSCAPALAMPVAYRNNSFAVYRLPAEFKDAPHEPD